MLPLLMAGGLFKGIFKRKPGGTMVGNFIRGGIRSISKGQLGNGQMMLQEGETGEDANKRVLQNIGAGVSAYNQYTPTDDYSKISAVDNYAKGATSQTIKNNPMLLLGGALLALLTILGITKLFKK